MVTREFLRQLACFVTLLAAVAATWAQQPTVGGVPGGTRRLPIQEGKPLSIDGGDLQVFPAGSRRRQWPEIYSGASEGDLAKTKPWLTPQEPLERPMSGAIPTYRVLAPAEGGKTGIVFEEVRLQQRNVEFLKIKSTEAADLVDQFRKAPKRGFLDEGIAIRQLKVTEDFAQAAEMLRVSATQLPKADADEVLLELEYARRVTQANLLKATSGAQVLTNADLFVAERSVQNVSSYAKKVQWSRPAITRKMQRVDVLDSQTGAHVQGVAVYVIPEGYVSDSIVWEVTYIEKVLSSYSSNDDVSPLEMPLSVGNRFRVCVGQKQLLRVIARRIVGHQLGERCKLSTVNLDGNFSTLTFRATSDFIQP